MNKQIYKRLSAALTMILAGLSLATSAGAVDLRDWGRKFPASQRFVVLSQFNNEAVLDKETQLVWQRTPLQSFSLSWASARVYCLRAVVGGRRGWRLPSTPELSSLADPTRPGGSLALPVGHPFTNVKLGGYWTATRSIDWISVLPQFAYYIDFALGGHLDSDQMNETHYYAWCVRGDSSATE